MNEDQNHHSPLRRSLKLQMYCIYIDSDPAGLKGQVTCSEAAATGSISKLSTPKTFHISTDSECPLMKCRGGILAHFL